MRDSLLHSFVLQGHKTRSNCVVCDIKWWCKDQMWKSACVRRLAVEIGGASAPFLSWPSPFLLIWCGWLLQTTALIAIGRVGPIIPARLSSRCWQPQHQSSLIVCFCLHSESLLSISSGLTSQQGCSQGDGIPCTSGSGACNSTLLRWVASQSHSPAPIASSVILSLFFPCLWHGNENTAHACQTERSRQQAVFLRTNFSVLYLACEWQLGALAQCTGTFCLIRPSLLPSLIKIGWETLLVLESAYPIPLYSWLSLEAFDLFTRRQKCESSLSQIKILTKGHL